MIWRMDVYVTLKREMAPDSILVTSVMDWNIFNIVARSFNLDKKFFKDFFVMVSSDVTEDVSILVDSLLKRSSKSCTLQFHQHFTVGR